MNFSFVIRTKNESKWICECLRRIYNQSYNGNLEVIVVDSGSEDDTVELAKNMGAKIFLYDRVNKWSWGRAINLGIQHSSAEVVVILSAHCLISSQWFLQTVDDVLRSCSNELMAAIYVRQEPIKRVNIFEEFDMFSWFPIGEEPVNLNMIRFGVSNSCAIIKRSIWKNIPFNEHLISGEDAFWAAEVLRRGYYFVYLPTVSVYHSHPFSVEDWYRRWYGRYFSYFSVVNNYVKYFPLQERVKNFLIKSLPLSIVPMLSEHLYRRDYRSYKRYIEKVYPELYGNFECVMSKVVRIKQIAFESAAKDWKRSLCNANELFDDYYVEIPTSVYSKWQLRDEDILFLDKTKEIDPSSISFAE